MSETPIADYALLSDCHSAALVSRDGSLDWWCVPRFDSPSVFGRILDQSAGHWRVAFEDRLSVERRYLSRALVLQTTVRTRTGTGRLTEGIALPADSGVHDLGAKAPRVIFRIIECLDGEVCFTSEFAPRPEYGRLIPAFKTSTRGVTAHAGGGVLAYSGPGVVGEGDAVRARATLRAGQTEAFAVQHRTLEEPEPSLFGADDIRGMQSDTVTAWQAWSHAHQRYDGPWADLVYHSGRVLQGLMYQPTGAIVAAPTTSLPEVVGGERNWDYRYAWVRDASFTLEALWVAACPDEAIKFFVWLSGAQAAIASGSELQIMFGVGGERDLTERTLSHLSGWRGSRPVRVGNGAWSQRQLDVYGELLAAAHLLVEQLGDLDEGLKGFLVEVADFAADRWMEPDQGIWEIRDRPRHFLYSKLMCWVALDRAIALRDRLGAHEHATRWAKVRDEIATAILQRGWSDRAKAFTQAFESDALDASALMMAMVGFLPASDPRMAATIDAIGRNLTDDRGLVYRYRTEDGLRGDEGTFLLCTFWLAEALALAGRVAEAREVFERAIAFRNDVGLLSEEIDDDTGELLGNFPQAFSHVGLIAAAWRISRAERGVYGP